MIEKLIKKHFIDDNEMFLIIMVMFAIFFVIISICWIIFINCLVSSKTIPLDYQNGYIDGRIDSYKEIKKNLKSSEIIRK